jgi:hypothetical protein
MLGIEPRDDTRNGVILWVKPIVRPGDTADVRQYKIAHPQFPQQSTSDQWYDESQFESYRKLGYDSIREYFPPAIHGFPEPGDYQRLGEFFNRSAI